MPADGQTTALVRPPIQAGGAVGAIVPQNLDDAWRIAGALAAAGMTPKDIDSQEKVLAVMMAGAEIGMPPFQALQSFAIINGRPSLWGDGMVAVVRKHGCRVEEWTEGSIAAGDFTAFCKVTRPDTGETVQRSFSMEDAKRAGLWQTEARVRRKNFKTGEWYEAANDSPWFKYPQRMVPMRARGWALRDCCADMLRGLKMAEEVQDYPTEEAHIVGEYDQRPAREVIGGQAGKDAFDDLAQRMSESEDAAALEIVWSEAERANLSSNRMFALSEHYEACKEALEDGRDTPPAPRFTEAPEPSPFPALKEEGEAVSDAASYNAWRVKLDEKAQARCTPEERQELRTLFETHRAKFGKKKAQPEPAGAGGTDKDAGSAGESGGAANSAGAEAPPASESAFERLKQACLDCLQAKAKRRALADWRKEVDACADLTDAERADLDKIEANVRQEFAK